MSLEILPIGERRKFRKVVLVKASRESAHVEDIFQPKRIELARFR